MEKIDILRMLRDSATLESYRVNVEHLFESDEYKYRHFFEELHKDGYIHFYDSMVGIDARGVSFRRGTRTAEIKIKGREFIDTYEAQKRQEVIQEEQAKSVEKTNQSVINTNKWMKLLTGLTVVISLTSLIKQCSQESQDKLILDKFEQHLIRQDSAQRAIQRKYDSILLTNRADSLTAKQSRR